MDEADFVRIKPSNVLKRIGNLIDLVSFQIMQSSTYRGICLSYLNHVTMDDYAKDGGPEEV